ncbi:hypothetical protein SBOR_3426 [Sclerotinia borealis F-4128]|uniref:Uncharacterized protein n=1 Tax=Sclerotinia borealis (strain F-4128) TaxID=1432307 RepID=W9CJV4_SCLBF|nr:hypothetical protein SBOR_3426 [Sclerotinia borealis F-4128]
MTSNTEEMRGSRQEIQHFLAGNRADMESIIVESTDRISARTARPHEGRYWQRRTIFLQEEFMGLLERYLEAGGIVLAAPILYGDLSLGIPAVRPSRVHLLSRFNQRFEAGDQLPAYLQYLTQRPGQGANFNVWAVENQWGDRNELKRLIPGSIDEGREDSAIWKWLFCDLSEGEDVNMVITDRNRWGWGGKFTWGIPLEAGEQWGEGQLVLDGEEQSILLL